MANAWLSQSYAGDEGHTCISTEPHEPTGIRDHILHYFACIDIQRRTGYFQDEAIWGPYARIAVDQSGQEPLRSPDNTHQPSELAGELDHSAGGESDQSPHQNASNEQANAEQASAEQASAEQAKAETGKKICSTAMALDAELKRIEVLRQSLCSGSDTQGLVTELTRSFQNWRDSESYQDNINKVKSWRMRQGKVEQKLDEVHTRVQDLDKLIKHHMPDDEWTKQQLEDHIASEKQPYVLERDFKAYVMEFKYEPLQQQPEQGASGDQETAHSDDDCVADEGKGSPAPSKDQRYFLKPFTEKQDRRYKGYFPNQKVSVEDLLKRPGKDEPPSILKRKDDAVRYIHIPCNNMTASDFKSYTPKPESGLTNRLDSGSRFVTSLQTLAAKALMYPALGGFADQSISRRLFRFTTTRNDPILMETTLEKIHQPIHTCC